MQPARVLIVPDKFKGSLTAPEVAEAIASGWRKSRPGDDLDILPMSDGGDGFGGVLAGLMGAQPRRITTVNAAHEPIPCVWWWNANTRVAIVESARVNGLAMMAGKKRHPFQLDTFGLGNVLRAAARAGAVKCITGVGGSATNDGGFGLARALGWKFTGKSGTELAEWWQLFELAEILPPPSPLDMSIVIAVDVYNPLLGKHGCSRIYGPQKGLRQEDFHFADKCLARLAEVLRKQLHRGNAKEPGAGAAGGLGFGIAAFAGGKILSGFDFFAKNARLQKRIRAADLVITAEGAMDQQTSMGKGVGQIARLCRKEGVPCVGFAGMMDASVKKSRLFTKARALTDLTSQKNAQARAARWLAKLSAETAGSSLPRR